MHRTQAFRNYLEAYVESGSIDQLRQQIPDLQTVGVDKAESVPSVKLITP